MGILDLIIWPKVACSINKDKKNESNQNSSSAMNQIQDRIQEPNMNTGNPESSESTCTLKFEKGSKDQTDQETAKAKLPKAIRDLQDQLNPTLFTPRHSKRTPRKTRKFEEEQALESPTKKRRIVTNRAMKQETTGLVPPPITPSKIVKPTFALADLMNSNTTKDSVSKKLDFSIASTTTPISPPVTPVKEEVKDPISITMTLPPQKPDFTSALVDKENAPPTVQCLLTPPKPKSIFARAKAIFQRSFNQENSETLPQRSAEGKALKDFFLENIIQQKSSSLYISGPPGTGKTAQTKLTLSRLIDLESTKPVQLCEINGNDYKLRYTYINCMTISRASNIYLEIFQSLTHQTTTIAKSKEALLAALSNTSQSDMNVIILDELDKLITADQQILFEIFSWVIYKEARMILVGISNALDMVDRLLPRLKINGLNPNTLSFLPYDSNQIEQIIKSRLLLLNQDSSFSVVPLMHPAAIKLVAKRSSSNTGDLRKAFDICRKAVELVEREVRGDNIFKDNLINSSDETSILIKINHVSKVCNNVFNQNQSSKLKNLNFLQKHIVCLLVKAENDYRTNTKYKSIGLNINSFYEFYLKNGKIDSLIGTLRKGEFLEVLTTIESVGIIQITRFTKQNYSESKISSHLVKKDLYESIKGITALENLINEEEIVN